MCLGLVLCVCVCVCVSFSGAETWKSPCSRIQMKGSRSGPKPLLETALLSRATPQTPSGFHSAESPQSVSRFVLILTVAFTLLFFFSRFIDEL